MPKFETIRRVPFSDQVMYDIVADVERYPQFLPLCESLNIISRETRNDNTILKADMTVAYSVVKETFRSVVTLDETNKIIATENLKGPFKHLENSWQFLPVTDESTDIHFAIDYQFKSWALEKLMGSMFEKAFRKYAISFENRARFLSNQK